MKSSGIGGQAVLEGIMMRHKEDIAVAVRKSDGKIVLARQKWANPAAKYKVLGWPIIRGVVSFIFSLVIGIQTLTFSASFFEEETPKKDKDAEKEPEKPAEEVTETKVVKSADERTKSEGAAMFGTIALSLVFAVALFVVAPYYAASGLMKLFGSDSQLLLAVLEGVVKLIIFLGYMALIGLMPDIKRTFMYHGSEHKCINCIESGKDLTVENVMSSSKEHRRCGTSFIFFVLVISIIFFMFLRFDSRLLRFAVRLLLIPIIAGVSYEFIQWAGNSDSVIATILSRPGMWVQALTTKEPTADMVEVAIQAVEGVFDWRAYLDENKESGEDAEESTDETESDL